MNNPNRLTPTAENLNNVLFQDLHGYVAALIEIPEDADLETKIEALLSASGLPSELKQKIRLDRMRLKFKSRLSPEDFIPENKQLEKWKQGLDEVQQKQLDQMKECIKTLISMGRRKAENPDIQKHHQIKTFIEGTSLPFSMKQQLMKTIYRKELKLPELAEVKRKLEASKKAVRDSVERKLAPEPPAVEPEAQPEQDEDDQKKKKAKKPKPLKIRSVEKAEKPSKAVQLVNRARLASKKAFVKFNERRELSLPMAIARGKYKTVELFVASGIDLNEPDKKGMTPLIHAVNGGEKEIVKLLLDNGAKVNLPHYYGWTPLMAAVRHVDLDIAKLLIRYGANVNAARKDGLTALMGAVDEGSFEAVELLLDRGANIYAVNDKKETVIDMARKKDELLFELIRTHADKKKIITPWLCSIKTNKPINTLSGEEIEKVLKFLEEGLNVVRFFSEDDDGGEERIQLDLTNVKKYYDLKFGAQASAVSGAAEWDLDFTESEPREHKRVTTIDWEAFIKLLEEKKGTIASGEGADLEGLERMTFYPEKEGMRRVFSEGHGFNFMKKDNGWFFVSVEQIPQGIKQVPEWIDKAMDFSEGHALISYRGNVYKVNLNGKYFEATDEEKREIESLAQVKFGSEDIEFSGVNTNEEGIFNSAEDWTINEQNIEPDLSDTVASQMEDPEFWLEEAKSMMDGGRIKEATIQYKTALKMIYKKGKTVFSSLLGEKALLNFYHALRKLDSKMARKEFMIFIRELGLNREDIESETLRLELRSGEDSFTELLMDPKSANPTYRYAFYQQTANPEDSDQALIRLQWIYGFFQDNIDLMGGPEEMAILEQGVWEYKELTKKFSMNDFNHRAMAVVLRELMKEGKVALEDVYFAHKQDYERNKRWFESFMQLGITYFATDNVQSIIKAGECFEASLKLNPPPSICDKIQHYLQKEIPNKIAKLQAEATDTKPAE